MDLKEKTELLQGNMIQTQKNFRMKNLVIHGIEEGNEEDEEQLEHKLDVTKKYNNTVDVKSDILKFKR